MQRLLRLLGEFAVAQPIERFAPRFCKEDAGAYYQVESVCGSHSIRMITSGSSGLGGGFFGRVLVEA